VNTVSSLDYIVWLDGVLLPFGRFRAVVDVSRYVRCAYRFISRAGLIGIFLVIGYE
jgi:hypothetical protein